MKVNIFRARQAIRQRFPMMQKTITYIILLVATCALMAGCGRGMSDADRLLGRIDSLADVNPDSADVLLTSAPLLRGGGVGGGSEKAPLPTGEKEVALLLRIKVDDKLYRPVTHYRDTILQLVSYFEQHPKVLPSVLGSTGPALPYLYAGRVLADLGDAPQALDYYQRALDAMPTYREGEPRCTTKQRGLLHSFIAETFYFQRLYNEAVSSLHEANHYATLANDTLDQIFNYRDIAEEYNKLNKKDSSLLSYQIALNLARQSHNINMCNDVMAQMARLYISLGNYENAKKCILPALHQIDSADISSTYSIASRIYKHEGKRDSALFCYNKLLVFGNIYGKRNAHRELSELALQHNDLHAATEHFHQYKFLDDSIRKMDNAETVARMHAAYNYQKHEKEAAQLKIANARKEKIIVVAGLVIAILATIIHILVYRYNQNKLRNARQLQLLKKIQNTQEHTSKGEEKKSIIQEDAETAFKKTEIYKTFLLLSQTQERLVKRDEWEVFSQEFNSYYPDFRLKLAGMYNLSTKQYRVCMLRKIGFGTTAICYLACYEKASVYSIYKRLYYQATGKKGSTADFDNLLKAL